MSRERYTCLPPAPRVRIIANTAALVFSCAGFWRNRRGVGQRVRFLVNVRFPVTLGCRYYANRVAGVHNYCLGLANRRPFGERVLFFFFFFFFFFFTSEQQVWWTRHAFVFCVLFFNMSVLRHSRPGVTTAAALPHVINVYHIIKEQ